MNILKNKKKIDFYFLFMLNYNKMLFYKLIDNKIRLYEIYYEDNKIITKFGYEENGLNINSKNYIGDFEKYVEKIKKQKLSIGFKIITYKELFDLKQTIKKENIFKPMLSHCYKDKINFVEFPCLVQPKLDGIRCIYKNGIFYSRTGKTLPISHIKIENIPENIILDGELYLHGLKFEEVVSNKHKLEYRIFDLYDKNNKNLKYYQRMKQIYYIIKETEFIKIIPNYICKDILDIEDKHKIYISKNYEGIMIKNLYGVYEVDKRSKNSLKYKLFKDDEYEIVSYKYGNGKHKDCIIWICKTKDNQIFQVVPDGPLESRKNVDIEKYIGKMVTVRFQELSLDGIPRFPKCVAVRNYE